MNLKMLDYIETVQKRDFNFWYMLTHNKVRFEAFENESIVKFYDDKDNCIMYCSGILQINMQEIEIGKTYQIDNTTITRAVNAKQVIEKAIAYFLPLAIIEPDKSVMELHNFKLILN